MNGNIYIFGSNKIMICLYCIQSQLMKPVERWQVAVFVLLALCMIESSSQVCNITNCNTCMNETACQICNIGYSLQSTFQGSKICLQCNGISGCQTCSSNNFCSRCYEGYQLTNGTCTLCEYPCQTCSSPNTCATCAFPYNNMPTSSGQCFKCQVSFCYSCSVQNMTQCNECQPGFSLQHVNDISFCTQQISCPQGCNVCQNYYMCQMCEQGYNLSLNSTCVPIQCDLSNCATCSVNNTNSCQQCSVGYYVSLQNQTIGVCKPCPFNCQYCVFQFQNSSIQCVTYKKGTSQFLMQYGNVSIPAVCDEGCQSCVSNQPSYCLSCESGYVLNTKMNVCVSCPDQCYQCFVTSYSGQYIFAMNCSSCFSNGFMTNQSPLCQACDHSSNCLTCNPNNNTVCTSCPYGYYYNSTYMICQPGCPENCLSCSSPYQCTLCDLGYANTNVSCVPCPISCIECSGQSPQICLSCGVGFYMTLSLYQMNTCQSCPLYCATCQDISSDQKPNVQCMECLPGYTLSTDFTCFKSCQFPCSTCSQNSPVICTSCLAGYVFSETTSNCIPETSCQNQCSICPLGFVLNTQNGTCVQCLNSNCARCSLDAPNQCTICIQGMYLVGYEGSMCQTCPYGCATCSSSTRCTTCSSGFTLQKEAVSNSIQICVPCASPCAECLGNPNFCTVCANGFTKIGWQCVASTSFVVYISLLANITTFNNNYYQVLSQLANQINFQAGLEIVSVTEISSLQNYTDLYVSLMVQNETSVQASQQYYNLQSLLQGSSIAGMPITAFALSSHGLSIESSQSILLNSVSYALLLITLFVVLFNN